MSDGIPQIRILAVDDGYDKEHLSGDLVYAAARPGTCEEWLLVQSFGLN